MSPNNILKGSRVWQGRARVIGNSATCTLVLQGAYLPDDWVKQYGQRSFICADLIFV
ncbi:MAG: hypothetical protein OXC30_02635 [Alphaproteobacteria bacterium]|nr:hypothetical protein [Alphaproteobacteria bacterium]